MPNTHLLKSCSNANINSFLCSTGEKSTYEQLTILILGLGFYLFELGWFFIHPGLSKTLRWIHHASTILFFASPVYHGDSGAECCALIFFCEVSVPIIMLRWFLREAGCRLVYVLALEYIFLIVFFYLRIILLTPVVYGLILHPNTRISMKVNLFILWAVSLKISFNRAQATIQGTVALWNGSNEYQSSEKDI